MWPVALGARDFCMADTDFDIENPEVEDFKTVTTMLQHRYWSPPGYKPDCH